MKRLVLLTLLVSYVQSATAAPVTTAPGSSAPPQVTNPSDLPIPDELGVNLFIMSAFQDLKAQSNSFSNGNSAIDAGAMGIPAAAGPVQENEWIDGRSTSGGTPVTTDKNIEVKPEESIGFSSRGASAGLYDATSNVNKKAVENIVNQPLTSSFAALSMIDPGVFQAVKSAVDYGQNHSQTNLLSEVAFVTQLQADPQNSEMIRGYYGCINKNMAEATGAGKLGWADAVQACQGGWRIDADSDGAKTRPVDQPIMLDPKTGLDFTGDPNHPSNTNRIGTDNEISVLDYMTAQQFKDDPMSDTALMFQNSWMTMFGDMTYRIVPRGTMKGSATKSGAVNSVVRNIVEPTKGVVQYYGALTREAFFNLHRILWKYGMYKYCKQIDHDKLNDKDDTKDWSGHGSDPFDWLDSSKPESGKEFWTDINLPINMAKISARGAPMTPVLLEGLFSLFVKEHSKEELNRSANPNLCGKDSPLEELRIWDGYDSNTGSWNSNAELLKLLKNAAPGSTIRDRLRQTYSVAQNIAAAQTLDAIGSAENYVLRTTSGGEGNRVKSMAMELINRSLETFRKGIVSDNYKDAVGNLVNQGKTLGDVASSSNGGGAANITSSIGGAAKIGPQES